jgi:DNA helicase-2/ATP-dependent DNA helicase PcrA
MTDIDNYDASTDSVVMMTLHSAKGLEFPVVFIPGMEEGVFPSMQTVIETSGLNEERRLAYVGITRAKEKLYLIKTRERMLFGSTTHNRESRFATEIPSNLMDRTGNENTFVAHQYEYRPSTNFDPFAKKKPSSKPSPSGQSYQIGNTVFHKVFGTGMITSVTPMGNDMMLEIAFDKVGTKTLMANFAKMEILS